MDQNQEQTMFVADAMGMLRWVLARKGVPARVGVAPVNFNSYHWMTYRPDTGGPLVAEQTVDGCNTFSFSVTPAGFAFMREHGWNGDETGNVPLDPSLAVEEKPEPLTSIWKLDSNRRIHDMNPWKAPDEVRERFADGDNKVVVYLGELYAVSFEELMGSDVELLFQEAQV